MALKELIRQTILEDIKKISILSLDDYANENYEILNFAYSKGIIDDDSIERSLEEPVLERARMDYELLIKNKPPDPKMWADSLPLPEFLAYGIEKKYFSNKELKKIPFDHGETPETFSKVYGVEDLLSVLRKRLLKPSTNKPYFVDINLLLNKK
jgi:hypothetical protein